LEAQRLSLHNIFNIELSLCKKTWVIADWNDGEEKHVVLVWMLEFLRLEFEIFKL
jgi:hypothetical protein